MRHQTQRVLAVMALMGIAGVVAWADSADDAVRSVAPFTTVWTSPPSRTPANHSVDGPLMGNGDIGVCLAGPPEALRYYLAKNDFWRLKSRYGQVGPRVFGGLDVAIETLNGADYHVQQRIVDGVTTATLTQDALTVQLKSWVAATDNLLVVQLSAQGGSVTPIIELWPAEGNGSDSTSGVDDTVYWAVRKFEQDVDIATEVAAAMKLFGADEASFTLTPDRPVTIVLAMTSRFKHPDPLAHVKERVAQLTPQVLAQCNQAHTRWWRQYWNRSYVQIGDPVLEKAYYQALYSMGAASRDPRFPPGIFGTWVTTDSPAWAGDYHTNYNHVAPFYALYGANRIEQGDPEDAPVLDFRERGRWYAENVTKTRGVLYPVGIGPLGVESTREATRYSPSPNYEKGGLFFQQRSNAAYCMVNIAQRWRCTYDPAYGRKVYPFVLEVVEFWEDYLKLEDGRYVIYGDAVHEGSGQNKNAILSLGLLYNSFDLALDMSEALDVDAHRREKWRHILDHLSGWTTQEMAGKTVFRYTEDGTAWWRNNTLGIQHIYPGNAIGLESDPKWLEVSTNTIDVMQRWLDFNGTNSFFPAAVRVGYDPTTILEKLRLYAEHSYPNGFKLNNPHGIENFSTVPNTINMMLCMSHVPLDRSRLAATTPSDDTPRRPVGVIRLFSVWPRENDARFENIRTWGAFLVSSALADGEVQYVVLRSEQGKQCTMVNPWPESDVTVYRDGQPIATLSGQRLKFPTRADDRLILGPAGVPLAELKQRMLPLAPTPLIQPNGGLLLDRASVTMAVDADAEIRFTTDGSDPTVDSARYTEPIEIAAATVLRARAFLAGCQPSPVRCARFRAPEADRSLINRFDTADDFQRLLIEGGYPDEMPRWIDRPGQGVRNPNPGRQGIVALHPTSQTEPCLVKRVVMVPAAGAPRLRIITSGDPYDGDADYVMQAGVSNGQTTAWFDPEVIAAGPRPSEDGWRTIEYDLSQYGGRKVMIVVKAAAGGPQHHWHNDRAYFDEISVVGGQTNGKEEPE